jgi:hypothetical protein
VLPAPNSVSSPSAGRIRLSICCQITPELKRAAKIKFALNIHQGEIMDGEPILVMLIEDNIDHAELVIRTLEDHRIGNRVQHFLWAVRSGLPFSPR